MWRWSLVLAGALGLLSALSPAGAAQWWCAVGLDADRLDTAPSVPITVPGQPPQAGNKLTIGHQAGTAGSWPTGFVLYTSGFVRLQPACVPDGKLGTSYVLGPAYWYGANSYAHNPQLTGLTLTGDLVAGAALTVTADGVLPHFATHYVLRVLAPTARRMECRVFQSAVCTGAVTLDPSHQATHQGFKLAQMSSYCYDSYYCDGVTLLAAESDGWHRLPVATPGFVDPAPARLAKSWVEVVGSGARCWEGFKPNALLTLASGVPYDQCTPQGWVSVGAAPDAQNVAPDNVSVWLNWDGAPAGYAPGAGPPDTTYRLTAQTNAQPRDWSPRGNGAALSSALQVVFDTPMRKALLASKFSVSPAVEGRFSWPDAGTLVFTPKTALVPSTLYRVRVQSGAQPTDGHPAAPALGWTLRTTEGDPPAPPPVAILLTALPSPQRGAVLQLNLSTAANVQATVCNLAGRPVAVLEGGDHPAGVSSLLWDGRSHCGGSVRAPAGRYLVRVVARAASGQQAQALASVDLRP